MKSSLLCLGFASFIAGCSSSSSSNGSTGSTSHDAGTADSSSGGADASSDATDDSPATQCSGPCPQSNVKHLVLIVQENHTFDNVFGRYCTADAGSSPSCTTGPSCCEAMPATDPRGVAPTVLTDSVMANYDPNHTQACELAEIDDGGMNDFTTESCSETGNVAVDDPTTIQPYWALAGSGAIADRYFQPMAGQSSGNDMYLARAQFVFLDNSAAPQGAIGMSCDFEAPAEQYTGPTIGDLLTGASVPWTWYSGGYADMAAAVTAGTCPNPPADCPLQTKFYPCAFDPSDVPFEYYASTLDKSANIQDLSALTTALTNESLPAVTYVKAIGYKSEHPGYGNLLSAGVTWATSVVSAVSASVYAPDTLILLTYDEGGGYFDHVAPPPTNTVDNQPYGMRIPLIAVGPFAKKNYVSHVTMEHSSIVKFIEWNWLGGTTGQLKGRDANVANIGDLLDPAATGVQVPSN